MRMTFALAAGLAAALSGAAVAAEKIAITPQLVAAAEKEGAVVMQYSAPLDAMQAMAKDFMKAYPKITVNLERKAGSTGAQALLQELRANVHRIDVFEGTDAAANQALIDAHTFVAVDPANAADFSKAAMAMAPYVFYPDKILSVFMYNPKFVSDAEAAKLKDWKGVLDPVFKDKISLVEPAFGVTLAPLLYVMNTPGLGEDFLRKLKAQNPVIYINTAQARDALISGQQPISWGAQWESVSLGYVEKGAPVRFVYPEPTVEYGGNGWALMENAPHPNAARLLFAWGLSRDGGLSFQGPQYNIRSALNNLEDTRESIKKAKTQSWFQVSKTVWSPDLKDWVTKSATYQALWRSIFKQ